MFTTQRCFECNGVFANCATRPGSTDGPGVPDSDIIIYVSGDCTDTASGVLAFASSCEMEDELDRLDKRIYIHYIIRSIRSTHTYKALILVAVKAVV